MTLVALAVVLVGLALVAAVHDVFRRALAAQVRQAELRVEAMRRVDYDDARKRMDEMASVVKQVRADMSSLDTAHAVGRKR
jgi:hypothetical protein